jgi:GNAT superfamily N-acetyltransferase
MVSFIDYNNRYKKIIDDLQKDVWGEGSDTDEIIESLENRYVKIALINDEVAGVSVCSINDKCCHIDFIIVKNEFQKKGVGSSFMEDIINYCYRNNLKLIECEAINVLGKINSLKLLEKYNFVCTYSKSKYWGELCPDFYCKQCNSKPCVCEMKKYIKQL